jgi:oligosaccharide repeat unit polymerase
MGLFLISILFVLTAINYCLSRDIRYPPFIFGALWLGVMSVYYFRPIPIDPITVNTEIVILISVLVFSSSGAILLLGSRRKLGSSSKQFSDRSKRPFNSPHTRPVIKKTLFYLSLLLFPALMMKAVELSEQSGVDDFFLGLHSQLGTVDAPGYGIIGNASIVSFFTTFIHALDERHGSEDRKFFYLSLLISIAYAILGTGRTPIFFLIVVLIGISMMKAEFIAKKLIWGVVFFLVSFITFAIVLGKGGDLELSWTENVEGVTEIFFWYLLGSIPAFDSLVSGLTPLAYGENTFGGILNFFYKFTGDELISPIQDWVQVPFPTNVYTGIQPLYKDFGVAGVIFGLFAIGLTTSYLYLKALLGKKLYIYFYALSLFPLCFFVFSDQYFAPVVSWIKYVVAGFVYFHFCRKEESSPKRLSAATARQLA